MSKLTKITDLQGEAYVFRCPGCRMSHIIPVNYTPHYALKNRRPKPTWEFNHDMENPTFKPAFMVEWVGAEPPQRCHAIIRDGWIIYLIDSTHALSGSRVKMEDDQ